MARSISFDPSRTLQEFRILPGLTDQNSTYDKVSLKSLLTLNETNGANQSTKLVESTCSPVELNIPILAAAMQAVSGAEMGIALSLAGGLAFIYCSQSVEDQSEMIKEIKQFPNSDHKNFPNALYDKRRRLMASAAINTHDYLTRVPSLIAAGVDVLLIDSSDGHTFYQKSVIEWVNNNYPHIPIIAGNVITADGLNYLIDAGAKAVKVGMGNGSICITQEQKGTGRGQATALMEVTKARDEYYQRTGIYVPVISDGGITSDRDIIIALALGADSIMMGRYFAKTEESPTTKITVNNKIMKPYWGEGSKRARIWREARYQQALFEEGVEGLVEFGGSLHDCLSETLAKIRSAVSTTGAENIRQFQSIARLELMSPLAQQEGRAHNIVTQKG